MPSFYPLEINGTKYLICKLPNQPFSTLHDPDTKQMVGQWNNEAAQYEIFPPGNLRFPPAVGGVDPPLENTNSALLAQPTNMMTDQQFEQHS